MVALWDNQSTAIWGWSSADVPYFSFGVRFRVTVETTITQVGYYRNGTGTTYSKLFLWDATPTKLYESGAPADSGAVGWQWTTLPVPVNVVPGVTYTVAGDLGGAGVKWAEGSPLSSRAAPPAEFLLDDAGYFRAALMGSYPTDVYTSGFRAIGVQLAAAPPPPPGPGEGDPALTGDLNSWLSSDPEVNTHQDDGLPWLTKIATDVLKTGQNSAAIVSGHIEDIVENIPQRSDSEWVKLTKLINLWLELSDLEYELLMDFLRRGPSQLTGPTPGGGSAFYGPTGRQVAETAERIEDAVGNLRAPLEGFPTEFELVDTIDFVDCVAWPVAADVYVLHVTTLPHGRAYSDVCGLAALPRAGWWTPLADSFPGEQHYFNFEFNAIAAPMGRLPGILIQFAVDGAATLEAWRRVTP